MYKDSEKYILNCLISIVIQIIVARNWIFLHLVSVNMTGRNPCHIYVHCICIIMMIKKCVYLDCIIKIQSMNIDYILLIIYD